MLSDLSIGSPIESLIKKSSYSFEQNGGLISLADSFQSIDELPDIFYSTPWKIVDLSKNKLETVS